MIPCGTKYFGLVVATPFNTGAAAGAGAAAATAAATGTALELELELLTDGSSGSSPVGMSFAFFRG